MSHELDISNGVTSFAGREPAWHRLGTTFGELMTAEQALDAAHLSGWNVRKLDLTATEITADGVSTLEVPHFRASARTNPVTGKTEILGTVGEGYEPIQNEEQVAFLQALVDESGAFIETAGALRGGRSVFVTCKLPESMLIGGVDRVDLYLAALNGHDGNTAFKAIASPVRIVCANTEAAALRRAKQSWTTKHTRGATQAIAEARESLALTFAYAEEFQAEAERMIQTAITDAEFEAIVAKLYGEPAETDSVRTRNSKIQKLDTIRGLYHDASTQNGIRGTRWGAYNALSEFEDWATPVKAGAAEKDARRALRAVDGEGVTRKNAAFELLRVPA